MKPKTLPGAIKQYEASRKLSREHKSREKLIREMGQLNAVEGEIEVDDNAVISEGADNGAYVMAWMWVSFVDTPLDKKTPEGNAAAPIDCRMGRAST